MRLDDFLERFDRPKRSGGQWEVLCPAHDDAKQSLRITEADGKILLHCLAGCSYDQVLAAVNLDAKDVMPDEAAPEVFAEYPYTDEAGKVLYVVERLVPKSFRQKRPEGSGWAWTLGDVRRVPYHLPALLEARKDRRKVFVVEGEKDVASLESRGFVATTVAGGANAWRDHFAAYFADSEVIVLPDNDDPGRAFASVVMGSLRGVARWVKIVALPVPEHGDVSDWFRNGGSPEQLKTLVTQAPIWNKPQRISTVVVGDVARENIDWLWRSYLPLGKLVVLEGDPGLGKSTIALDIAARITTGSPMPDMEPLNEAAPVLLFTSEDAVADTIRPRLEAAHADLSQVQVVQGIDSDTERRVIALPQDIGALEELVGDCGIRFVVIDPFVAFLGEGIDAHRDQDIRRALYPLAELARRTKSCVMLMRHLNKGKGPSIYRGGGSIGIIGAVRVGMVVAPDPSDVSRRVFAVTKSNLARTPDSLVYRLVPADLLGVARVAWQGPSALSADELLSPKKQGYRGALDG